MSIQPAPLRRAGNFPGMRVGGSALALGALSLILPHAAFGAETAQDIIKKMANVYNSAKTFQATVSVQQSGKTPDGKTFNLNGSEKVQYQSPNLFHKVIQMTGTGSAMQGPAAQQLALRNGEVFSDGKTATMYVAKLKQYAKQPAPPSIQLPQLIDLLRQIPPLNTPGLTLLPNTTSVQGRTAYIIEIKPVMPAKMKPEDQQKFKTFVKQFKQYPRFFIDKQNYQLLEVSQSRTDVSAKVALTSQVVGGSIPASTFSFNPPAGAKEFKQPPPGSGGVPGGVPGGAPVLPGGHPK